MQTAPRFTLILWAKAKPSGTENKKVLKRTSIVAAAPCLSMLIATLALAGPTVVFGAGNESWNSELFPRKNGTFAVETVTFGGRQWTLDDFSYAGYRLGEQSLGGDPCRRIIGVTGKGDISREVQAAIDSAGKLGGGIVAIPKGRYTMASAVSIPWDNVSIIGEGSAETLIQVPSNYDSHEASNMAEGLFTFG